MGDELRYLEAQNVSCPAGSLVDFHVCADDREPLGTVEGVLISPAARRLEYLVIARRGLFGGRRFVLPLEAGAVVEQDARVLRIPVPRRELRLEGFQPRAVQPFTDDDLLEVMFGRDAA